MVVLSGSCRVISCLIHIRSLHTKGWAKRKQITFREALAMQPHRATCCCQPTNRLQSASQTLAPLHSRLVMSFRNRPERRNVLNLLCTSSLWSARDCLQVTCSSLLPSNAKAHAKVLREPQICLREALCATATMCIIFTLELFS